MMIRAAIVEDDPQARQQLTDYLERLHQQLGDSFLVSHYADADQFLFSFQAQFDLIFMDIQMPHVNGLDAAHRLREIDPTVALVFVTSLARYAINGYEVSALDYILKPLTYDAFYLKMQKVVRYCRKQQQSRQQTLMLSTADGEVHLPVRELMYVEISAHTLVYHTAEQSYASYGTLKQIEKELLPFGFFRCNSCYLINLQYVQKVDGYTVWIGKTPLTISHPRKSSFTTALTQYRLKELSSHDIQ